MGMKVDETTLASYASQKWNISIESAEKVLEILLWGIDDCPDLEAIWIDADSGMSLSDFCKKHKLDIPEEIIKEAENG